jgi:hypothetical protein
MTPLEMAAAFSAPDDQLEMPPAVSAAAFGVADDGSNLPRSAWPRHCTPTITVPITMPPLVMVETLKLSGPR